VFNTIDRLPETQRETVLLVYGEGFSYAEAARALGIPVGTVMSRIGAARSTLAKMKEHFT
jgi:RNA polymerase sigma-70 factor (ECF subfamily)